MELKVYGYVCKYVSFMQKVCIFLEAEPTIVHWYTKEEVEELFEMNDFFRPVYSEALKRFPDATEQARLLLEIRSQPRRRARQSDSQS